MRMQLRLAGIASLFLAAGCNAETTTACTYQLTHISVTLQVGQTETVANASRCVGEQPVPTRWAGRHPEVVTVTTSPDLNEVTLEANAPGADTVTADYASGRSIVFLVEVTR